jgi:hypothetical protein
VTIEQAFLARLAASLDEAGIPYMVAGSLGSSLLGQYRTTNDADIVIAPTPEQLEHLLRALQGEYYLDPETARKALEKRSMFNVIEFQTGSKADLIVRKDRPFSIEEFNRRRQATILGTSVWTVTAEDAILSKLEWAKMGESERQFQDALGVAVVQMPGLDWDYLRRWGVELNVVDLLNRMIAEIDAVKRPEK